MSSRLRRLNEQFQVRLPDGMRDRLKVAAGAAGRSMNSEIVARLTASLDDDQAARSTADFSDEVSDADLAALNAIGERTITGEGFSLVAEPAWPIGREPSASLDVDRLDRLTTIVDRTRLALGANAARELWPMLGLPPLRTSLKRAAQREDEPDLLSLLDDPGSGGALPTSTGLRPFEAKLPREYVSAFMRECCERDPEAETPARVFRQGYVVWADRRGAPVPMASVLGKYAIGLGLRKRKANGSSIYLGLRIRPQEVRSGTAAGV